MISKANFTKYGMHSGFLPSHISGQIPLISHGILLWDSKQPENPQFCISGGYDQSTDIISQVKISFFDFSDPKDSLILLYIFPSANGNELYFRKDRTTDQYFPNFSMQTSHLGIL